MLGTRQSASLLNRSRAMTHTSQDISPLRQRMIDDMRMRKLAPKTQAGYVRVVRQFTAFLGRPPDTAAVEDLRRYQLHLVDHGVSPISLNAAITGLKFFFDTTLGRDDLMAKMHPVYLPRVLPLRTHAYPAVTSRVLLLSLNQLSERQGPRIDAERGRIEALRTAARCVDNIRLPRHVCAHELSRAAAIEIDRVCRADRQHQRRRLRVRRARRVPGHAAIDSDEVQIPAMV